MDFPDLTVRLCSFEDYARSIAQFGFPPVNRPSSGHRDEYSLIVASPVYSSFSDLTRSLSREAVGCLRFVQVYYPKPPSSSHFVDEMSFSEKEGSLREVTGIAEKQGRLFLEFDNPRLRFGEKWTSDSYQFRRIRHGKIVCVRAYFGIADDAFLNAVIQDVNGQVLRHLKSHTRHLYAGGNLEQIASAP